jgi:uncharacterized phage protein gp47/JayE
MPIKRKTFGEFQTESLNYLQTSTPFTNIYAGSSARSITDIVNKQMAEVSGHISNVSAMAFLDTSSGYHLDLIASFFGLSRYAPATYITTAGDKNIKFFVTGVNTLKRALGTNSIIAGTKVRSADGSIELALTNTVEFNDTDTFVFVGASIVLGSKTVNVNAGSGQIVSHSLGISNVFVTNTGPINYSNTIEGDRSFRSRIASAAVASEGANRSQITSTLLRFQDIASIDIRSGVSGSGSYDIYLVPTGNRVSQATIASVASTLSVVSGFGISFNIREFDYIPIKIEVRIEFISSTGNAFKETLIRSAESRIQGLIGSLRPGDSLAMNRIIAEVINTDPVITNAEVVFLCVNKRVQAIRDLRLENDELFVPDEDEINPIMVRQ